MGIGATHINHIVISSNDSSTVALSLFAEPLGNTKSRPKDVPPRDRRPPQFAKLHEVVLEFGGPPQFTPGEEVKAKLWGFVLAGCGTPRQAVDTLRHQLRYPDPRPSGTARCRHRLSQGRRAASPSPSSSTTHCPAESTE